MTLPPDPADVDIDDLLQLPMPEAKHSAERRLKGTPKAFSYKEEVLARVRRWNAGREPKLSTSEVRNLAWKAMMLAYPPVEVVDPLDELSQEQVAELAEKEFDEYEHTRWCLQNLENKHAYPTDAPSLAAWGILMDARKDRNAFHKTYGQRLIAIRGDLEKQKANESARLKAAEEKELLKQREITAKAELAARGDSSPQGDKPGDNQADDDPGLKELERMLGGKR